jgi:FAD dependent oxidoreductase
MSTIREPACETPIVGEYDLCVLGGSCTGVFAAVAAARLGLRVAIVELNGFFGGVATAGLVNIWHSDHDTVGKKKIIQGLTIEVLERLSRRNATITYAPGNSSRGFLLNTEELKIELDELVTEHKIRPFLHTRFTAPLFEDNQLTAVAIEDKTGRRAIRARYFIDATGDGDLVARMGLAVRLNNDLQPPTTCASIYGIKAIADKYPDFSLREAIADPNYPEALDRPGIWASEIVGIPGLHMVAGTRAHDADCSDADQLTQAEIECRRQVRQICDLMRNHFPTDEGVALASIAPYIGIRETRKVSCLHQLTEEEVLTGVQFPDAIANGSYRVDVHHSTRSGITFRYLNGLEVYSEPGSKPEAGRWRPEQEEDPTFYQIPYRCLVPQGATNVLVAGRMIDTDRGAHGATRVMVNTNQMGEAAGTAAALALGSDVAVADVDTKKLRTTLERNGALII